MPPLYALSNIIQRFGAREVLNIPELRLHAGKIYALLGPNGAGKTTLMRILAFMDTPAEGSIAFMGEATRPEQAARYRARVVWVPQSPVMFTGTLLYNVEYPMRLQGVGRAARKSKALELLENVNLISLAKAPARRLSGGEAQRASIARALAAGAQVILFDEPTASVDFRSREELITLIRDLWRLRGLSLIITTHDAELAAELCQERITLFDGKLAEPQAYGPYALKPPPALSPFSAWPGRLEQDATGLRLYLSGLFTFHQDALVVSLTEENTGFFLRLRPAKSPGPLEPHGQATQNAFDIFLPRDENAVLIRSLHLGSRIALHPEAS